MATVITSIGTRAAENVNITAVSGSGPYTVTVDSVPSGTKVGDILNDEAATPNTYLITGISGSDLTVTDSFGAGAAPSDAGSSQATTERAYAGSTTAPGLWEADLDDTDLYSSGDTAEGEGYNDGGTAFDDAFSLNGGGTVGLTAARMTVAEDDRHDGTAGTGTRIVNGNSINVGGGVSESALLWWEIDQGTTPKEIHNRDDSVIAYVLVHSSHRTGSSSNRVNGIAPDGNNRTTTIFRCVVYNIVISGGTSNPRVVGIGIGGTGSQIRRILNCTVWKVESTSDGAGDAICIEAENQANQTLKNNIALDALVGGAATGTQADFSFPGTDPDSETNLSSDDTADDAGGSGHLINKLSSDQFVSTD